VTEEALEAGFNGARIHVEKLCNFGVTAALEQEIGNLAVAQTETDLILFILYFHYSLYPLYSFDLSAIVNPNGVNMTRGNDEFSVK
jgi:hypothetical protein